MHIADLENYVKVRRMILIKNKGKQFEGKIFEAFEKSGALIERLPDQVSRFKGSTNPSDFIVYQYPNLCYIECKSTESGSLNFDKITQWQDLLERSKIPGVVAGVIIWFINNDFTTFVDIRLLECMKQEGYKSVPWDCRWAIDADITITGWSDYWCHIKGVKKRVYYDYDMTSFFKYINEEDKDYGIR